MNREKILNLLNLYMPCAYKQVYTFSEEILNSLYICTFATDIKTHKLNIISNLELTFNKLSEKDIILQLKTVNTLFKYNKIQEKLQKMENDFKC